MESDLIDTPEVQAIITAASAAGLSFQQINALDGVSTLDGVRSVGWFFSTSAGAYVVFFREGEAFMFPLSDKGDDYQSDGPQLCARVPAKFRPSVSIDDCEDW